MKVLTKRKLRMVKESGVRVVALTILILILSACLSKVENDFEPISYVSIVENNQPTDGFDFPVEPGEMTGWEEPPHPSVSYHEGSFLVHREDGIHPAIDFFREDGTSAEGYEIRSIGDGVVVDIVYDRETYPNKHDGSNRDQGWGNLILIQHDYIDAGIHKKVFALYAHCKTIEVEMNEVVKRSQRIGLVGKTDGLPGLETWPDHLHFEIRKTNITSNAWPSDSGLLTDADVLEHWIHPLDFIRSNR